MSSTRVQASFRGTYAPYPSAGYPYVDFVGAGNTSPRTGAVGGAGNMGAASGQTGVNQLLPHNIAASKPLAIIAVVAVGYIIWHISSRL